MSVFETPWRSCDVILKVIPTGSLVISTIRCSGAKIDTTTMPRLHHMSHDDVIPWKHFPRYWPFERGIHQSPVGFLWCKIKQTVEQTVDCGWLETPYMLYTYTLYTCSAAYAIHPQNYARHSWWRHNGCDGVSNHRPHDCLFNRLFRRRSKKTSQLRVTGLCVGNSPETDEFPAQMASNAENVSIRWRHHDFTHIIPD